jgi:hypothetical protein
MRNRFTRAFFAASAAAVVSVGLAASTGIASASTHVKKETSACDTNCQNLFVDVLGSGQTMNAFVPGDTGLGGKVGQKVNLHFAENNRPNGDFIPDIAGRVWQFCGFFANDFFSPTSYICLNYPFFQVFELNWAPYGNESGLCSGVARAGVVGESVTLQICGASANTVWVLDRANASLGNDCRDPATTYTTLPVGPGAQGTVNMCPWLNGGDTSFSDPLVLTAMLGTHRPPNQLQLQRELFTGGEVKDEQLFSFYYGSAP